MTARIRRAGLAERVLTPEARAFLAGLHRSFETPRAHLIRARSRPRDPLRPGTAAASEAEWAAPGAPADLADRRVEISGPATSTGLAGALGSGARVAIADFEDAMAPAWDALLEGQTCLADLFRAGLPGTAVMVRPRGLHLTEQHWRVGYEPIAASLFDIGLFLFHNAEIALAQGSGPYLCLPKLESPQEARLYDDLLRSCEDRLGLPRDTVRVTVMIETVPAALQIEELMYELRGRITGLSLGRWDYVFSAIKEFGHESTAILPDRDQITWTTPFLSACSELVIDVAHKHGAHATVGVSTAVGDDDAGGARAAEAVRADAARAGEQGFDGVTVTQEDLVGPAAAGMDAVLGGAPHQLRNRPGALHKEELITFRVPEGTITQEGVRNNVSEALVYIEAWLRGGVGRASDLAAAEVSRSQLWQWRRHKVQVQGLGRIDNVTMERILDEEQERLEATGLGRLDDAAAILHKSVLTEDFIDCLPHAAGTLFDI